uniref:non-specific serine/threonine protein kinase n=1 Tax=Plectus sambesii TaxID=2011161 RepID=A0A914X7F0_9BILA
MQRETERKVNLTHLVPKNSLDAAIRISSLNGWSKTEQLGQGAYGEVWKYAVPMEETPIVAGKHLKVQLWNLNEMQKSDLKNRVIAFITELNMLYKMSSKYSERFVQFIGWYLDSNELILFTECMPNGSIKDHILKTPLDEATALKYTFQAAQGLNFLHHYKEGRIVHRDIKCDNLLLTSSFNVKLADFGLAHNLAVDNKSYTMSQSAPCGFAGTVIFAAPEVLIGEKYGRRADIWSLGCTLVEILTCHPPHAEFWYTHQERAQFLFIERAQAEPAHQLQYIGHQLVPNASAPVQTLLDCLFTKNKAHRPKSEEILDVFTHSAADSEPKLFAIDANKLEKLRQQINAMERSIQPS